MDTITLKAEESGLRLDVFITGEIESLTRSAVGHLIDKNLVTVNGEICKASRKTCADDIIRVTVPDPKEINITAENIPLDIVYEDEDIIVVNKLVGMVVHPAPGHYTGTLVNALMHHCKNSLSGINSILRPGIVHRIDRDTSGVLVVAKNNAAHLNLSEQFARHSIKREYYAIVFNGFPEDFGKVDKPIGRHPVDRKKMAVVENGRHAVTNYSVIERLGKYTLISARLETGRTHQIRVHMASINHPLLGDMVYGSQKQPLETNGQVLHAKKLGFIHPCTNSYIEFDTELPTTFSDILELLRKKS